MDMSLILNGNGAMDKKSDDLNSIKHNYRFASSMIGCHYIAADMCWSTGISSSLTDGPWTRPHSTRIPCMGLHEKHGASIQSRHKKGTISLNLQWPWYSMCGSYHHEFQIAIAPKLLYILPNKKRIILCLSWKLIPFVDSVLCCRIISNLSLCLWWCHDMQQPSASKTLNIKLSFHSKKHSLSLDLIVQEVILFCRQ